MFGFPKCELVIKLNWIRIAAQSGRNDVLVFFLPVLPLDVLCYSFVHGEKMKTKMKEFNARMVEVVGKLFFNEEMMNDRERQMMCLLGKGQSGRMFMNVNVLFVQLIGYLFCGV